jgi:hypothetical protein
MLLFFIFVDMKKIENLSLEELEKARDKAKNDGYIEITPSEQIELGVYSGLPAIVKTNNQRHPAYTLIQFEKINKSGEFEKLFYEACKFNIKNLSTGRSHSEVVVKTPSELKIKYSKPENLTKEVLFEAVKDEDGRTVVKLISIAK